MDENNHSTRDDRIITYTIAALGPTSWFVESDKGTSGYSFHSLLEAERFAVTLAKRNTPSKVRTVNTEGEPVDELIFNTPDDTGR
jgi:hypothetical protein